MFWSFAHPYDILNLYDFLSTVRQQIMGTNAAKLQK